MLLHHGGDSPIQAVLCGRCAVSRQIRPHVVVSALDRMDSTGHHRGRVRTSGSHRHQHRRAGVGPYPCVFDHPLKAQHRLGRVRGVARVALPDRDHTHFLS